MGWRTPAEELKGYGENGCDKNTLYKYVQF